MTNNRINRNRLLAVMVGTGFGLASAGVFAHDGQEMPEGQQDGHLIPHEAAGLTIGGGTTWILQGSDGNGENDTADLSYSLDLTLEGNISKTGKVFIALEAGNGAGMGSRLGSLSTPNYDAFITDVTSSVPNAGATDLNSPNISQLYYEGNYRDGKLLVHFGKLDVSGHFDDNAFANDETDQFLSALFVRSAGTTYAEMDQYYAPGLAVTAALSDALDVMFLAANGNASGFDSFLDHPYGALQFTVKTGSDGTAGNYRFYGIYDARDGKYTDIATGKTKNNVAWGLSFDQAIGNLGLFARYSAQDNNLAENLVKSSWSAGAVFNGASWNHADDALGVAYGSVNVNNQAGVTGLAANPGNETHGEVYYKFGISEHFTVSPSVQMIQRNGGDADAGSIRIYGVRTQLNF